MNRPTLLLALPFGAFLLFQSWAAAAVVFIAALLVAAESTRAWLSERDEARDELDVARVETLEETLRETNRRVVSVEARISAVDNRTKPTAGGVR